MEFEVGQKVKHMLVEEPIMIVLEMVHPNVICRWWNKVENKFNTERFIPQELSLLEELSSL